MNKYFAHLRPMERSMGTTWQVSPMAERRMTQMLRGVESSILGYPGACPA